MLSFSISFPISFPTSFFISFPTSFCIFLITGSRNSNHEKEEIINDDNNDDENEDDDENENNQSSSSFLKQIDEILSKCPDNNLQRALFSATIGPFVKELALNFLNNPITVSVGVENAGANTIDQKLIFVGREDGKLLAIRQLVQQGKIAFYSFIILSVIILFSIVLGVSVVVLIIMPFTLNNKT